MFEVHWAVLSGVGITRLLGLGLGKCSLSASKSNRDATSILCSSLAIASACVANHFSIIFDLPELLVHEHVVLCPLLSGISMVLIPRSVAFVMVVYIMFLSFWLHTQYV